MKIIKKKIAILLTGFVRNWKDTINNLIVNFVSKNDERFEFDLYGVTYNITDDYTQDTSYKRHVDLQEINSLTEEYAFKDLEVLNYRKTLNKILWDNQQIISLIEDYIDVEYKIETILMQCFCIQLAYNKIQHKKYDFVMRSRFDVNHIQSTIIQEEGIANNEIGCLSRPSSQNFVDHVVFGTQQNLRIFCNTYSNLQTENFITNYKIKFVEDAFLNTLLMNKIKIKILPWICSVQRRTPCIICEREGTKDELFLFDIRKFNLDETS